MDAITTYTYSTSAWFGIQAVPLLFFPQLVTALLSPEARRSSAPPSSSHLLALPTLVLTTAFHSFTAFYAYMQYTNTEQTAFALSLTGSGLLAAMGVWCLLFASAEAGGKDKVSGWPFKNDESDRRKSERRAKRST